MSFLRAPSCLGHPAVWPLLAFPRAPLFSEQKACFLTSVQTTSLCHSSPCLCFSPQMSSSPHAYFLNLSVRKLLNFISSVLTNEKLLFFKFALGKRETPVSHRPWSLGASISLNLLSCFTLLNYDCRGQRGGVDPTCFSTARKLYYASESSLMQWEKCLVWEEILAVANTVL